MFKRAFLVVLSLAAAAAVPAQKFAQKSVDIRAGVLVIDSQQHSPGVQRNYTPHLWGNLDANRNVKPAGWNFYNPNAATRVTDQIRTRWAQIHTALGYPAPPAVGSNITKRDAPYWEVFLTTASDAQITDYDILSLTAYGVVQLNSLEREKLRKFLEGGGVLWVDLVNGVTLDAVNNLPLPIAASLTAAGTPVDADLKHPLLSTPHAIGFESLNAMQSEVLLGLRRIDFAALGRNDLIGIQGGAQAAFDTFLPVAQDNIGPAVMAAQVGDGFIVVTCRGVAATLNRTQVGGTYNVNNAFRAYNPLFDRGSDAAAKLVTNMAHLTSSHAQMGKGARKSNSTPIDIGAPLLKRFDSQFALNPGDRNHVPPVIFNGMAIISAGNQVVVYDANPSSDLNGDGNPDDGLPDYNLGSNVDLVWVSQNYAGPLSAPSAAEVPDAGAGFGQQIAVTDVSGNVLIFSAFPANPLAPVPAAATIAPPGTTSAADTGQVGRGPYAPTYHDGVIFVTDEASAGLGGIVGRVWMVDARTGTRMDGAGPWQAGGSSSQSLPRPATSAVVGYIPIADNSGGVDRVVYFSGRHNPLGGPNATAGITSLWLGARGEKPTSFSAVAGMLTVNTRASGQGLPIFNPQPSADHPLGIKITILDANGNPLDPAAMDGLFTGTVNQAAGILNFNLEPGANLALIQGVRVDYTIDWGTGDPGITSQLVRGNLTLPDDPDPGDRRRILHNMALSPQGTLHFIHGFQPSATDFVPAHQGGALYSIREEGRGAFKLLNRYELYPQHTFVLNQAGTTTVRETFIDGDELPQMVNTIYGVNILGGNFANISFQGGPSIHNGVVYVTARANKGFVPCTILMAFQADPDIPQIYIGDIPGSFTILQPDLARSNVKNQPDQYATLQPAQYVYEREPGADRGTLRLDNLMASNRGPMQNAISRSQPIIIRRSGQPDQLIYPDSTGSRWNPMLWYYVGYGVANSSPPTVTGKTVFFGGQSFLPDILEDGVFNNRPTGLLVGLDSDISPTDPFLISNTLRPWMKQLWNLKVVSATDIRSNPTIRWPQASGVMSFEAWAIRLLQTALTSSTVAGSNALGVVAGDGVLLSWAPEGIWGFSKADFLIADEGRLARFDPSGNPIWSSDASIITGPALDTGSAGDVKPLIRPTRAYAVSQTTSVVVDTGADRIVRLDNTGRELRSLDRIVVDPTFVPEGFETNEPLSFKSPRDVMTYTSYVTTIPFSNPSTTGMEYWVHHVIADAGNRRIVELVDRYAADPTTRRVGQLLTDANGQKALGVLMWHSPAAFSGKNFYYTGIARVWVDDGVNSRYVYAAGIGSALPTRVDTGIDTPSAARPREAEGGNGGIVIFDGANSQVINEVEIPAIPANVFFNRATGVFDAPARPARTVAGGGAKKLSNLTSVTMRNIQHATFGNRVAIMFTDAEGVFEILQPGVGGPWVVDWMLPNEAFRVLRRSYPANLISPLNPRGVRLNYARRLDSGEVLVVNGYTGQLLSGAQFDGEVLQIEGGFDPTNDNAKLGFGWGKTNLGHRTFSIRFELPPVQGTRGLLIPVFADRR